MNKFNMNFVNNTVVSNNSIITVADIKREHEEYLQKKAAYAAWASNTLLKDVIVGDTTFEKLFTIGTWKTGEMSVVFNPTGEVGSPAKGSAGFPNALLHAFGTRRYEVLEIGLHQRMFDKAMPYQAKVKTILNPATEMYEQFSWKTRRMVHEMPKDEGEQAGWLAKHTAIDNLLISLAANSRFHLVFFKQYDQARFERNVLGNMEHTVEEVNIMMGQNADTAQKFDTIEREARYGKEPGSLLVGGVEINKLTAISVTYNGQTRRLVVDPENVNHMKYLASALNDKAATVNIVG